MRWRSSVALDRATLTRSAPEQVHQPTEGFSQLQAQARLVTLRRTAVDNLSALVTWLRRRQRVRPVTQPTMVNIGSGLTVATGWLNVDGSANALFARAPGFVLRFLHRLSAANRQYSVEEYVAILKQHQFVHHDVAFGLPFADESVDYAYSSHLLEHLRREQAERLVAEIWRTLKSRGYVRICVPDLSYAVSRYQAGDKDGFLFYFFGWPDAGRLAQHRYMYDYEMLTQLLHKIGFVSISRCNFREGHTPDIASLDSRPEETLFVEAMKP